jgi:hypothetical protein
VTAESVSRITLGRGVVGKSAWAFVALAAVLGIVAWRLPDPTVVVYAATGAFILFFAGILLFAHRNPVWTTKSVTDWYEILRHHMTKDDTLLIYRLDPSERYGWGPQWVWEWLDRQR